MDRYVMSDSDVSDVFATAGRNHGFEDVKAEFSAFKDFKVRWTRSYRWAEFEVSDYLVGAPVEVMESLADVIFRKIKGDMDAEYSEEFVAWMTSAEFLERNRPTYVARNRLSNPDGDSRLAASVARVAESHPEVMRDVQVFWGRLGRAKASRVSVLMKAVAVNDRLDDEQVPDGALDLAVYASAFRASLGFGAKGNDHTVSDRVVEDAVNACPDAEARDWLKSHNFNL